MSSRTRNIAGWTAAAISTFFSALWAFWGSIENFHEGWYYRELWRNFALMFIQYIPWMFIPMVALAFLYAYGRPTPVSWARRMVLWVPLATAVVCGAYPGWRSITRPSTVDLSMRHIAGNGVDLVWAPASPGWDERGFSWFEAKNRCDWLTADGTTLAPTPQHLWRLPSVDETVRTMIWRGRNAGGEWDAATHEARYREMPDKEAPLWNPYSMVIYWWTSDEADASRAYIVVYNGRVNSVLKKAGPAYMACRCVRSF